MPEPFFVAPFDYGCTHPDPDAAIDAAVLLCDQQGDGNGAWARILHGVSTRLDLTPGQARRLIEAAGPDQRAVAETLLTNPAVGDVPEVRDLFSSDLIPYFLDRADVSDFADQILRATPGPRRWTAIPEADYHALIVRTLGVEVVEDYFARTCLPQHHGLLVENARHPLLPASGFDRLVAIIEDIPDPVDRQDAGGIGFAQRLFEALCHRADLSPEQGLRLVAVGTRLAKADPEVRRWVYDILIRNPQVPASVMTRLVTHRTKRISNLVLTQPHVQPETIFAAVRAHLPHALARLTRGPIPAAVVEVALADLEAGRAREGHPISHRDRQRFAAVLLDHASGPAVWDRVLGVYRGCTAVFADEAAAVAAFYKHVTTGLNGNHPSSGVPDRDHFLSWATGHRDPALRAQAVPTLYLPEQVTVATRDPSPLVRAAAVRHPRCPASLLPEVAGDPAEVVRAAVVEHPGCDAGLLSALAADPSQLVRELVADRFLSALG